MLRKSTYQLLLEAQALIEQQAAVITQLTTTVAPVAPDGSPMPSIPDQLVDLRVLITGQLTPIGPPMQNRTSSLRLNAHDVRLDQLEQFTSQLLALSTANTDQARVLTAQQQLAQQTIQMLQAQQAAYEVRLAANDQKDILTASATEANRLDIIALKAEDAAKAVRDTKNEALIGTAQATATQARAEAAAAQKLAADDAAALLLVQAQAKAAQDTATAAQQAQATFAARFRSVRLTLPAIPLLGLDVVVSFAAFADPAFTAIAEPAGLALLGLDATELPSARTASTATFRIKPLSVALVAGGVLNFIGFHD